MFKKLNMRGKYLNETAVEKTVKKESNNIQLMVSMLW